MENLDGMEPQVADHRAIGILLQSNFECPSELRRIQALRDEGAMALELVVRENARVVGYAAFVWLDAPKGWVALAPLVVRGDRRKRGVRARLVRAGIDALRHRKVPAMLALGDPTYYQRFGFSVKNAALLRSPYPQENLMVLPFQPDMSGRALDVTYPPVFFRSFEDL